MSDSNLHNLFVLLNEVKYPVIEVSGYFATTQDDKKK